MTLFRPELNYPALSELPESVWIFLAKAVGAIAGSAISIAYILPNGRREAVLRFMIGMVVGLTFGSATGLKIADELGVADRMSELELAISGATAASLCAWWGLGILSRLAGRLSK